MVGTVSVAYQARTGSINVRAVANRPYDLNE